MFKTSSHFSFEKLLNVFLRISGMGSKFIIFTLLSKKFNAEDFGNYSLIISLITVMIFILGLDFYNFSIRDIIKTNNPNKIRNKISSGFLFYVAIYLVFFTVSWFAFQHISYTKPYLIFVILLCITEHLSQEIYRLFIAFEKVLLANILLFIRTAGWGMIIIYFYFKDIPFNILYILKTWLVANSITILYALFFSLKLNSKYISTIKIDYQWIKKGIYVCYLFFTSTIFLKIIEYSNRFIVDYYLGKEIAGIYTFYSSIAILITVYINTIVISFELPKLIKFTDDKKIIELFRKFKKSLLVQTAVACVGILLLIKPILYWQNKHDFEEYLPLLLFMVISVALMNYSLAYHFKLYIKHKDIVLVKIMVISGVASIILSFIFTKFFGVYGSAFAFTISSFILYITRYFEAKKVRL